MPSEIDGNGLEIISDGKTVWVNSAVCLGRFSQKGIDVHKDLKGQLDGSVCLDCKEGPCDMADWLRFVEGMKLTHKVNIGSRHMPKYLRKKVHA